mgnify:CR=1 FL=1
MRNFEGVWHPTQADFDLFAEISGDDNPIHVDPDFSAKTRFGRTVSHGMLLYSKLWGLLQQNVPDAQQASQELMFPRPCYAGDVISLKIEETETNKFAIVATRQSNDENVLEGTMELA